MIQSILAFPYPTYRDSEKPESYINYEGDLMTSMLEYPVKINSVLKKFEKASNLIINIYACEDSDQIIVPGRVSSLVDYLYAQFLKSVKDVSVSMENIQRYTKDLQDLHQSKRLVNLFINKNYSFLIKKFMWTC